MDIRSIVYIATLACAVAVPMASAQTKRPPARDALAELSGVWTIPGHSGPDGTITVVCRPNKSATCHLATGDGDLFFLKQVGADAEGSVTFSSLLPGNRVEPQPMTLQALRIEGGRAQLVLSGYSRVEFAFVRRTTDDDGARVERLANPCGGSPAGDMRACVQGETDAADRELMRAFKSAVATAQRSAREAEIVGLGQIGENNRREEMCGGKLPELLQASEPDQEKMLCHARMMRSRAKVLARYASTNTR